MMIAGVHLLGLACVALLMIPALRDRSDTPPWWQEDGSDEDWRHGPKEPPKPPTPPRGGIPLPNAGQARVRLRDHGRLADHYRSRQRRAPREPDRTPVRTSH